MSASPSYEAAYRPTRLQFVRESTAGSFVTNPSYNLYSDNIRSFEPSYDPDSSSQRGLGDPDSQNAFAGTEISSLTVSYDLQQKSGSGNTLLDNGSNPNDAITDAFQRDADNRIQNTHQIVHRKTQTSIAAGNTVDGATSRDSRKYHVISGAYPDTGTLTGDPSDGQPILAQIDYEVERGYIVQIDQPTSGEAPTTLDVSSSSTSDTTQTLTIEDDDAGTTEGVSLNGTSTVTTSNSFSSIDALELDSETAGDVTVSVNGGDDLAVIYGQNSFDHGEGQLGVPALGASGSNASAIGQSYELYHDDNVERPDGTTIADGFETTEFSVANSVEGTEQGGTPRRALSAVDREVTMDVTVFGESEQHNQVLDMLRTTTDNARFDMNGGYVQADSADVRGVSATESVGDGKLLTDLTIMGQGLTVST